MKRHKSRTLLGRTLSRVKSRITSFGSPTESESPNPLIAPPSASKTIVSPTRTPRAYRTVPQRSPAHDSVAERRGGPNEASVCPPPLAGASEAGATRSIAAVGLKPSTWTVFGTHPKYPATAYVNFEISAIAYNDTATATTRKRPNATDTRQVCDGYVYDLTIKPTVSGPGIILKQYGDLIRPQLSTGDRWILVLHVGIKDTSLASRLSTSFRSLGGRLGRISNVEVINRWLDVLQRDTAATSGSRQQPLEVSATVEFRHSLLPPSTILSHQCSIEIAMTAADMERAKAEGVKLGDVSDDEDEERLQEMRVLGAPWL